MRERQRDGDGLAEDPLGGHETPASQLPLVLQQVAHVGADPLTLLTADGIADQRVLLEERFEDPVDDRVGGGEPGVQRLLAGAEPVAVGAEDRLGHGVDQGPVRGLVDLAQGRGAGGLVEAELPL